MGTGRAAGKRNFTRVGGDPGTSEGKDIGESIRLDPNGWMNSQTGNVINYETVRQEVLDEPLAKPEFSGMQAHGVPTDSGSTEDHAVLERGELVKTRMPKSAPVVVRPDPVPVYIVEDLADKVIRSAYPRHITVPNNATDAVRICGRAPNRVKIGLLNEDQATDIRFAQRPSDLNANGGALLPWPNNSYQWFETQDELYAVTVSASATAFLSVIEIFEQEI